MVRWQQAGDIALPTARSIKNLLQPVAEIPADAVNGESIKVWRYKKVVWPLTKTLLT